MSEPEKKTMTPEELKVFRAELLKPNQWKPGQSGNPAGRPKGRSIKNEIRRIIEETPKGKEIQEELAMSAIGRALAGDFRYWKAIFEVIDGPLVGEQSGTNISGNNIQIVFDDLRPPDDYKIPEMPDGVEPM